MIDTLQVTLQPILALKLVLWMRDEVPKSWAKLLKMIQMHKTQPLMEDMLTGRSQRLRKSDALQPMLALSLELLMREESASVPGLRPAVGRMANALVAVLGPELTQGSKAYNLTKALIREMQATPSCFCCLAASAVLVLPSASEQAQLPWIVHYPKMTDGRREAARGCMWDILSTHAMQHICTTCYSLCWGCVFFSADQSSDFWQNDCKHLQAPWTMA